jgi:hypothetical protein
VSGQLSLDALMELRRTEIAFAEEAIESIARAGIDLPSDYLDGISITEDSDSWIGQIVWELRRLNDRAAADLPRMRRLLARIVHENVDSWLLEKDAQQKHADVSPPRRIEGAARPAAPLGPRRLPRTPKAELEEVLVPTKKLTERQRELVSLVEVTSNVARYTPTERIPDWPLLKTVMLSLGAKWASRKGFVFPDDVDGAETVRIALEKGEIIDWDGAGFFPTPDDLADSLVARFVDLPEVPHVLEPSGGTGSLVRAMRRRHKWAEFYACELIDKNRDELEKLRVDLVGRDFMALTPDEFGGENIHAIVMNPPFAKRADIKHITHAIDFLNPGGQLAAIASAGVLYRDDKLANDFRTLVTHHGGVIEPNPEGSFASSGTMVRTVSIWLRKAEP